MADAGDAPRNGVSASGRAVSRLPSGLAGIVDEQQGRRRDRPPGWRARSDPRYPTDGEMRSQGPPGLDYAAQRFGGNRARAARLGLFLRPRWATETAAASVADLVERLSVDSYLTQRQFIEAPQAASIAPSPSGSAATRRWQRGSAFDGRTAIADSPTAPPHRPRGPRAPTTALVRRASHRSIPSKETCP